MSMFYTNLNRVLCVGLLFALAFFVTARRAEAIENAENQSVRALLDQSAEQAAALDYDADQMTGYLHSPNLAWQIHADMLSRVKEHVNDLGKTITKLEAQRSQGNPMQQEAIDREVPLLRELAKNTTAAIDHINRDQNRPVSGHYPEYLDANADTAHELNRLIHATVEYGHSKTELNNLEQQIEVASK
jgi:hypothetical protein